MCSGFGLSVESASALFERLRTEGITLLHEVPVNMGHEQYWFMFRDPAGNIIEVIGGV